MTTSFHPETPGGRKNILDWPEWIAVHSEDYRTQQTRGFSIHLASPVSIIEIDGDLRRGWPVFLDSPTLSKEEKLHLAQQGAANYLNAMGQFLGEIEVDEIREKGQTGAEIEGALREESAGLMSDEALPRWAIGPYWLPRIDKHNIPDGELGTVVAHLHRPIFMMVYTHDHLCLDAYIPQPFSSEEEKKIDRLSDEAFEFFKRGQDREIFVAAPGGFPQ